MLKNFVYLNLWLFQGNLLTEHLPRFGCVQGSQNEFVRDAEDRSLS